MTEESTQASAVEIPKADYAHTFKTNMLVEKDLQAIADSLPVSRGIKTAEQVREAGGYKEVQVTKGKELVTRLKRTLGIAVNFQTEAKGLVDFIPASAAVKEFIASTIIRAQLDFIKNQYVDLFLPVRESSLEYIIEFYNKVGGRISSVKFTAEALNSIADLFGDWLTTVTGGNASNAVAALVSGAKLKFTPAGIIKAYNSPLKPEQIQKILGRVAEFGALVADGFPDAEGNTQMEDADQEVAQAIVTLWTQNLGALMPKTSDDLMEGI